MTQLTRIAASVKGDDGQQHFAAHTSVGAHGTHAYTRRAAYSMRGGVVYATSWLVCDASAEKQPSPPSSS